MRLRSRAAWLIPLALGSGVCCAQQEQLQAMPWVERSAFTIELVAVALLLGFVLASTAMWLYRSLLFREHAVEHYKRYRQALGRSLLLGLEILVAADIVRTVASPPALVTLASLGLLVLIRTFLGWSIVVEIEGRWPWQAPRS